MTPKVSVILPTYNRAYVLDRAVQSVLNQTYTDFELIIIDDGSTDNTVGLVNGYDDRLVFLRHEKNKGVAAARNTGIRASRGEWIAFQDSDDIWLPEKLERQFSLLGDVGKEHKVVYTRIWRVFCNGVAVLIPNRQNGRLEGDLLEEVLHHRLVFGVPSVMVKKSCFDKVGPFDERLFFASDYEMWIRLAQHTMFVMVDAPLVVAVQQSDSLTAAKYNDRRVEAMEAILHTHAESFTESPTAKAELCFLIGTMCCLSNKKSKGRFYLRKALRLNRRKVQSVKWQVISLLPARHIEVLQLLKRRIFPYRQQIDKYQRERSFLLAQIQRGADYSMAEAP